MGGSGDGDGGGFEPYCVVYPSVPGTSPGPDLTWMDRIQLVQLWVERNPWRDIYVTEDEHL